MPPFGGTGCEVSLFWPADCIAKAVSVACLPVEFAAADRCWLKLGICLLFLFLLLDASGVCQLLTVLGFAPWE